MRSIELFAGAGGLTLGTSQAGFIPEVILELNENACKTMRENRRNMVAFTEQWPDVTPKDVTKFDFGSVAADIDLIAAGVPCQPWSLGGKHRGFADERNLFPHVVRAVLQLRPKAVIIENVKGLTRRVFSDYFDYIQHQLRYPEIPQRSTESWTNHFRRLQKHHDEVRSGELRYSVFAQLINAADFGIPQRRERVFVIAFRSDLAINWQPLKKTHSLESLLYNKYVTGDYWSRANFRKPKLVPEHLRERVAQLTMLPPVEAPWKTVREALAGMPDPVKEGSQGFANHVHNPGARSYKGHTGSLLDLPAKTLKAGVHGVPGGENTLAYGNGEVRYFTTREAARLQTFGDEYVFYSSWTESMRQIGNAVPVELGAMVAEEVVVQLRRAAISSGGTKSQIDAA